MPLVRPTADIPRQKLITRFVLIYLPIAAILSFATFLSIRFDEERRIDKTEMLEATRSAIAIHLVTQHFSTTATDLRLLANLPALKKYLDTHNPAHIDEVSLYFVALLRESRIYDQARYLDLKGQEIIRVNYNNGNPEIIPREQLQDKSGRYYFRDTIKLDQGEIYVSPFDLNVEHNKVEIPHKPMIRFGTPVFDSAGHKQGIILLNYLGNDLLQHFREAMNGGEPHSDMLLNRDGYWLVGPNPEDEWGFMLGKSDRTFGHDFANAWRVISQRQQGSLRTDEGIFIYTTVYPLEERHYSSTGSPLPHTPSEQWLEEHEYYWKIVTFIPSSMLTGAALYNQIGNLLLLVLAYLLLALAAWIIALVTLSRKQARSALQQALAEAQRFREVMNDIPAYIYIKNRQHQYIYGNRLVLTLFKKSAEELPGSTDPEFFPPETVKRLKEVDDRVLDHGEATQEEIDVSLGTTAERIYWEVKRPIYGENGEILGLCGISTDITERKRLEAELARQASTDVLTGINNRRHFFELAEQELARSKRHGKTFSLFVLDIDHFKVINDTYGHHAGDIVLQKLSRICLNTLREIDILGRIGGEEFAILLPETDGSHALEIAGRLRMTIEHEPVSITPDETIHFTGSIGVTSFTSDDTNVDEILRRADAALYKAKNKGRNLVCGDDGFDQRLEN